MSIDSAIGEQLSAIRRRDLSQRILSEALSDHTRRIRSGRSVLSANEAFAARIRRGRIVLAEYAIADKQDAEKEGVAGSILGGLMNPFEKALQVASDLAIRKAFQPYLISLLNSLGLDEHPRFRELVSGVIVDTVSRMVSQAIQGDIPFSKMGDCEFISQSLAKSIAEAVPKALFDTFLEPGVQPTGVMLTLREVIANYFADTKTVDEIARSFKTFVCKVSFADLVTRGSAEIEDVIKGVTATPGARA